MIELNIFFKIAKTNTYSAVPIHITHTLPLVSLVGGGIIMSQFCTLYIKVLKTVCEQVLIYNSSITKKYNLSIIHAVVFDKKENLSNVR